MASQSKAKRKNIPKSVNEMSKEELQETLKKKKECNAKALEIVEILCEVDVEENWFLENQGKMPDNGEDVNNITGKMCQDESADESGKSDIDSYYSEENIEVNDYDSLSEQSLSDELSEETEENEESVCDDYFIGKDKITKWYKIKNDNVSKINIVKETAGLQPCAKDIGNELDAFFKIIDIKMIDEIVSFTNIHINQQRTSHEYSRERDCKETSRSEFLAYLGLLYMIGLKKSSHANEKEIWATDGTGIDICRAVMSYKRFLFLTRSLRFDDKTTRVERRKTDKLAAIRTFFDAFVHNSKKCFKLSEYTTIDEMLLPFRGRCSWVQCIPSKPAKYGIKMYALCDAKFFYTSNLEIYCGKQPDGPFALSNTPFDIVKRLVAPIENSYRNLTTDNYYTSVPLADYLLEKKITLIGTLNKNKREIPKEFLPHKSKEIQSSLFGFQKDKMITSYVPRKNSAIILLSTLHNTNYLDPTKKPLVVLDYNATKGGVDTVDKLCSTYSVSRITKRWPSAVFYSLINIGGINAHILYSFASQANKKLHRRLFLKNLALSLMKEHLTFRASLQYLPFDVKAFLKLNYGVSKEEVGKEMPASKRGTCRYCVLNRKRTSASMRCSDCQKFTCKEHSTTKIVCNDCSNTNITCS